MHTEISITIHARPRVVFRLAEDIARWPEILPHYRYVRMRWQDGDKRVADMGAWRGVIPVSWKAEQEANERDLRVTFRHIGGVTKGMEVEWVLDPVPEGVRVTIRHDLKLQWPVIGSFVAERIIGPFFISSIAGKTLRRMKELAEARPSTAEATRPDTRSVSD